MAAIGEIMDSKSESLHIEMFPEIKGRLDERAEPFIKWVGGKRNLLDRIENNLPSTYENYFEPFVGGGALFFALSDKIKHATISDSNIELMIAYKAIQKQPRELIELLKEHKKRHSEKYYYEMRDQILNEPLQLAARFIYLNKTCYNGLYRVNNKGFFNVPIGSYENPTIFTEENIMACSKALENTHIRSRDFEDICPEKDDFVYLDPPYHPTSELSFTKYTKQDFSEKDHIRLRDFIVRLTKKNVKVMLSNSKTKFIEKLYSAKCFTKIPVHASRVVNCKPDQRNGVEELLITNYINT